ncbi:MAG: hypothetical protein OEM94_10015 [Acidimicrobiia bacterium]|nr:hypothetical protein [Acidimicrobiia bacterium]
MTEHKRRLDQVKDADFLADLEEMPLEQLRAKRTLCDGLDTEYSYYRRMVHGRMDMLAFEIRRRTGEEKRTLMEALPEILAGPGGGSDPSSIRSMQIELPDLPNIGRRDIDTILDADFLSHLSDLDDDEITRIQAQLTDAEIEVSENRRIVFESFEKLQKELTRRYREGLASADELLGSV